MIKFWCCCGHQPTHHSFGEDLPPLLTLSQRSLWHSVSTHSADYCFCPYLLCKTKSPSTKQALSVETQILPLVSEVISILMEIHIYGLSSILLIQCSYNNAFHIIIALLCEYKFRLPVHNMLFLPELSQQGMTTTVKWRHFWLSVKSLLHSVLFLVSFYMKNRKMAW